MAPTDAGKGALGGAEEGAPAWGFGLSAREHVGLLRELVRLAGVAGVAGVAGDARGDDVVPTGASLFVAGDDVIEIEVFGFESILAVLAAVGVAPVDVLAGEFDLLLGEAIEE